MVITIILKGDEMLDRNAIATRIKILRGNLSQREFAALLAYRQTYISEVETGKAKPSVEFLYVLSEKLNVTVDWILKGNISEEEEEKYTPMVPIDRIRKALKTVEENLIKGSILELNTMPSL